MRPLEQAYSQALLYNLEFSNISLKKLDNNHTCLNAMTCVTKFRMGIPTRTVE